MCSIPTVPVTLMFCIDFFHLFFSPLFSSHPVAGVVMLSFYAFQYLYHCWMPVYRFCTQLWWKHVLLRCIRKLRLPCWGKPLEKKKDTLYRKKNTFLQSLKTFLLGGLWFLLAYLVFFLRGGCVWPSLSTLPSFRNLFQCHSPNLNMSTGRDFTSIHPVNEFLFSKFCPCLVQY